MKNIEFDTTGWEQISNPCRVCGVDRYYVKFIRYTVQMYQLIDIKQFHTNVCHVLFYQATKNRQKVPNEPI